MPTGKKIEKLVWNDSPYTYESLIYELGAKVNEIIDYLTIKDKEEQKDEPNTKT